MFDAAGPSINYPYSVHIEEFLSHPFFPAVFKNEATNAGKDKFLIETPEQLEIFKKFYETYKNRQGYKEQFECSIFQQLIETPTENKTYMRVLMSASGDVLGASLKYSRPSMQERPLQGTFEKHLLDPKSPFYLHSSQMFNYYSGGGDINLGNPRFSYSDKEMLIEHGIDPENPEVPAEVTSNSIVNVEEITKRVLRDISYNDNYEIINNIGVQSPDIALGTNEEIGGAGDNGMMFGYACNDNNKYLPDSMVILQELSKKYDELRKVDNRFLPDGKAQITVNYTSETSNLVDKMIKTKSSNSNEVKGIQVD